MKREYPDYNVTAEQKNTLVDPVRTVNPTLPEKFFKEVSNSFERRRNNVGGTGTTMMNGVAGTLTRAMLMAPMRP